MARTKKDAPKTKSTRARRCDCAKCVTYRTRWHRLSVAVAMLVVGCGPIGGGHVLPVKPAKVETIEQAAASSLRLYHERLASAFETLAGEIEQGGIEDDEDLASRMEELTKTARLGSFEAFRAAWAKQAAIVTEWDASERAERCRETARGFTR